MRHRRMRRHALTGASAARIAMRRSVRSWSPLACNGVAPGDPPRSSAARSCSLGCRSSWTRTSCAGEAPTTSARNCAGSPGARRSVPASRPSRTTRCSWACRPRCSRRRSAWRCCSGSRCRSRRSAGPVNLSLLLSATWHVHPYFLGSDSMVPVAWLALVIGRGRACVERPCPAQGIASLRQRGPARRPTGRPAARHRRPRRARPHAAARVFRGVPASVDAIGPASRRSPASHSPATASSTPAVGGTTAPAQPSSPPRRRAP